MKLAAAALLCLTAPAAFGLQWSTLHLSLVAKPLQREAEAAFTFTNTGTEPVEITGVDSSCDCLQATASTKVVAPGASGTIRAHFTIADRVGTYTRTIIVSTSEDGAATALSVELTVPDVAELSPRSVEWKLGAAPAEQSVAIDVAPGLTLALTDVHPTSDAFRFRLETVEPGRRYRLVLAPRSTAQVANAALRVSGKTGTGEEIVLSAYANVR